MKLFSKLILALTILFVGVGQGFARPVSDIQKKELVQLVGDLNAASARKDVSLIVNNMPERLYKEMAIRMHTTEVLLRDSLQAQLQAQFDKLDADGYRLDVDGITYHEAKDGTPYAFVPTRVEINGSVSQFMTLALIDNTKWHLIYGGQKTVQNAIFLEIYPHFVDISMPIAKVEKK